jgi:hypothetical protein
VAMRPACLDWILNLVFFFYLTPVHPNHSAMLLVMILGYLYAAIKSWVLSVGFINKLARILLRPTMNLFRGLRSTSVYSRSASQLRDVVPRAFPTTGFTIIPASETIEEERWPWYTPQSFYPVRIGDVLYSKYQVLYKLGYGTTSTIWMCRNLRLVPLSLLREIG